MIVSLLRYVWGYTYNYSMTLTWHIVNDNCTWSLCSLVGSLSIIISALYRRQLKSSKVMITCMCTDIHIVSSCFCMQVLPLFILSIADSFLSISLIIGGIMWWTTKAASGWCLIVSLLTVVCTCKLQSVQVGW